MKHDESYRNMKATEIKSLVQYALLLALVILFSYLVLVSSSSIWAHLALLVATWGWMVLNYWPRKDKTGDE